MGNIPFERVAVHLVGFRWFWKPHRIRRRHALRAIAAVGGELSIRHPLSGELVPVLVGLNDGQVDEPDVLIHLHLPALSSRSWNLLRSALTAFDRIESITMPGFCIRRCRRPWLSYCREPRDGLGRSHAEASATDSLARASSLHDSGSSCGSTSLRRKCS